MGLSLPITPEEIKQRYRALAKQWHPDLHPNNPEAEQRMKEINAAAEMLTGIDANAFQRYAEKAQYRNVLKQTKIEMDGTKIVVNFIAGELLASDWIYAAAFAAGSDSVYLASYSGRIVHVDKNGKGLHAYDIGNIPTKIVDTGDYLYLLTGTRLYVIQDNKLHTLVDTFYSGDLVVAQTGFGLLEKKRLRWYRKDGTYLGSVDTKNPIRRVYSIPDGMVVETRQRRALIRGAPVWWE
ncbi:DnaJ domain-containing protein [Candidatus Aerophobetes bacterium]|nr:DnaJ domain-containing protein [Candidatus Aerophobetes bacterium]